MPLTPSQQGWLRVRSYVGQHRHELAVAAAAGYPMTPKLAGTPLLAAAGWQPDLPVPLARIPLAPAADTPFHGVTGTEPAAGAMLPVRPDGTRYDRYSAVVADLAKPRTFQDRPTYRLAAADLGPGGRLAFGRGSYFDSIDVGDTAAHEFAAYTLGETSEQPFRNLVGDPCNPARRPVNVAVSTLTLRRDPAAGTATTLLHRRDGAAVGHAGGMFQVLPVGVFQPSGAGWLTERTDFSLWRSMIREYAEELLGQPERHGTDAAPIDYDRWPLATAMTAALATGRLTAWCLGLGVDPLTLATDLLTAVVIDAPVYDELFGAAVVRTNDEGRVLANVPFDADTVDRYAGREPTQAAGAALLRLAWRHRGVLLG